MLLQQTLQPATGLDRQAVAGDNQRVWPQTAQAGGPEPQRGRQHAHAPVAGARAHGHSLHMPGGQPRAPPRIKDGDQVRPCRVAAAPLVAPASNVDALADHVGGVVAPLCYRPPCHTQLPRLAPATKRRTTA